MAGSRLTEGTLAVASLDLVRFQLHVANPRRLAMSLFLYHNVYAPLGIGLQHFDGMDMHIFVKHPGAIYNCPGAV